MAFYPKIKISYIFVLDGPISCRFCTYLEHTHRTGYLMSTIETSSWNLKYKWMNLLSLKTMSDLDLGPRSKVTNDLESANFTISADFLFFHLNSLKWYRLWHFRVILCIFWSKTSKMKVFTQKFHIFITSDW